MRNLFQRDEHRAVSGAVAQRVLHQVVEHGAKQAHVGVDRIEGLGGLARDAPRDIVGKQQAVKLLERVKARDVKLELARLELVYPGEAVNHIAHVLNRLVKAAPNRGRCRGQAQRHAQYGQRGLELVGEHGHELGLVLAVLLFLCDLLAAYL